MYGYNNYCGIENLLGKTLVEITGGEIGSHEMYFKTSDGEIYKMFHEQDCCEHVAIEDITGDLNNLLNSPVVMAEEVSNSAEAPEGYYESYTWTFYKLATINGYVTLRWLGESNGYYSESVSILLLKN